MSLLECTNHTFFILCTDVDLATFNSNVIIHVMRLSIRAEHIYNLYNLHTALRLELIRKNRDKTLWESSEKDQLVTIKSEL